MTSHTWKQNPLEEINGEDQWVCERCKMFIYSRVLPSEVDIGDKRYVAVISDLTQPFRKADCDLEIVRRILRS